MSFAHNPNVTCPSSTAVPTENRTNCTLIWTMRVRAWPSTPKTRFETHSSVHLRRMKTPRSLPRACQPVVNLALRNRSRHLTSRHVSFKKKHETRRLPLSFGSLFVRVQTRSSSLSDPRRFPSNPDTDPNRSFRKRRCVETWCRRWRWRRPLVRICSAKQRRSRRV